MSAKVEICNSALIKVGSDRISDLDQDVRRAILLKAIYENIRDCVLREHNWSFARKRAKLTANNDVPAWGYTHTFDLPNDCLALRSTSPSNIDYMIEGKKILSDESEISVIYTYKNDVEDDWEASFKEAFATRLAAEIAYALTQSAALSEKLMKDYLRQIAQSRFQNGAEQQPQVLEADDWISVRRSGRFWP